MPDPNYLSFLSLIFSSLYCLTSRLRGWQRSAADLPILLQPFVRQFPYNWRGEEGIEPSCAYSHMSMVIILVKCAISPGVGNMSARPPQKRCPRRQANHNDSVKHKFYLQVYCRVENQRDGGHEPH